MPTVIDSLIVTLGLDPRNFNQGQRQAVQNLRQFQNQGTQALAAFLKPLMNTNQQMGNLTSNARRAGLAVQAGARAGQSGLLAMAAAGTAAYTAIKSVQGIYNQVTSTIERTAGLQRIAQASGVTTTWLSRFQNAAKIKDAANPEQTASSVFNFRQGIEQFRERGVVPSFLLPLSQLGVQLSKVGESVDQAMDRIFTKDLPEQLRKKTLPAAIAFGQSIGLSPELTRFLYKRNVPEEMENVAPVSVTEKQAEAANKLSEAIRKVEVAWEGLIRSLQTQFPQMTTITTQFAEWLKDLQQSPAALEAIGETAATVIGITLIGIVGKFVQTVLAANAQLVRTPLGLLLMAALGAKGLLETPTEGQHENYEKQWGINKLLDPRYWFGAGPAGAPNKADDRSWWQRNAPKFLGGTDAPVARAGIPGGTPLAATTAVMNGSRLMDVPVVDNMTDKERDFLRLVLKYESIGGQNVMNYKGAAQGLSPTAPTGYTAQGYYQLLNSNWARLAPGLGIKAPNAMAATPEEQTRVALALLRGPGGVGHWTRTNARLAAAMAGGEHLSGGRGWPFPVLAGAPNLSANTTNWAPNSGPGYPSDQRGAFDKYGNRIDMSKIGPPRGEVPSWVLQAQAGSTGTSLRAGGALGGGDTSNSVNVNGDINVHTQAKDANGIALGIGGALRQNVMAAQVNTGLR